MKILRYLFAAHSADVVRSTFIYMGNIYVLKNIFVILMAAMLTMAASVDPPFIVRCDRNKLVQRIESVRISAHMLK